MEPTTAPAFANAQFSGKKLQIDITDAVSGIYDPGSGAERLYMIYDDDGSVDDGIDGSIDLSPLSGDTYQADSDMAYANMDGKQITYRVYAYDNDNDHTTDRLQGIYNGSKTWDLSAPVATAASATNSTSFTANWNAVTGADDYRLDVSTNSSFINSVLDESFAGFTGSGSTQPADSDFETDGSNWMRSYVYENSGNAKLGSSSERGILTTPVLDLSSDDATVNFDAKRYSSSDNSDLIIQHVTSGATTDVQTIDLTDTMTSYSVTVTGGGASSRIRFYAKNKTSERLYLDNITVALGDSYVSGYSNKTVTGTSSSVTGLDASTAYYYRLRAASDGGAISDDSNVITATTTAASTGPKSTIFMFK